MAIKKNSGSKNLRPQAFKKGQSGNPKGRPPMKHVQEAFKEFLAEEVEYKDKQGKVAGISPRLNLVMKQLFADSMRGKVSATDILLERAYGKAKMTVEHEGSIDFSTISEEHRRRIILAAVDEVVEEEAEDAKKRAADSK